MLLAWPPSSIEGARFERADSRERARPLDVLLVDDFPDEEDITKLKLLLRVEATAPSRVTLPLVRVWSAEDGVTQAYDIWHYRSSDFGNDAGL